MHTMPLSPIGPLAFGGWGLTLLNYAWCGRLTAVFFPSTWIQGCSSWVTIPFLGGGVAASGETCTSCNTSLQWLLWRCRCNNTVCVPRAPFAGGGMQTQPSLVAHSHCGQVRVRTKQRLFPPRNKGRRERQRLQSHGSVLHAKQSVRVKVWSTHYCNQHVCRRLSVLFSLCSSWCLQWNQKYLRVFSDYSLLFVLWAASEP